MKLVLATRNLGKVNELTAMLSNERKHQDLQLLSLQDFPDALEVVEDGETYEENAIKKATVIADYTGYRTLADDAGLEVEALDGAPGVHSKRWAGEDATDAVRIKKLLATLENKSNRNARFVAAIAIAEPTVSISNNVDDGTTRHKEVSVTKKVQVVLGICEGHISHTPAGDCGFGYDPIFVPNGFEKSFAELGDDIKNQISHRSHALRSALRLL